MLNPSGRVSRSPVFLFLRLVVMVRFHILIALAALILVLLCIAVSITDRFSVQGVYNCHKYCNESYMGKIKCSTWNDHCYVKCSESNVYIKKYGYCTDDDGWTDDCKIKVCEER